MAYTDHFDTVQKIYIAYYQRPADPGGLLYWAQRVEAANGDIKAVVNEFAKSAESDSLYGQITATTIGSAIEAAYTALFGAVHSAGKDFYVGEFTAGRLGAGDIVWAILAGALNDDAVAVSNKLEVAKLFTRLVDGREFTNPAFGSGNDFDVTYNGSKAVAARNILNTVTSASNTKLDLDQVRGELVDKIAQAGDPILQGLGNSKHFTLTPGTNIFNGGAGNDVFDAPLVNEVLSLDGSDRLDGGGGWDTLNAYFGKNTSVAQIPGSGVLTNIDEVNVYAEGNAELDFFKSNSTGVKVVRVNGGDLGGTYTNVTGAELTEVELFSTAQTNLIRNVDATGNLDTGTTLKKVSVNNIDIASSSFFRGNAIDDISLSNVRAVYNVTLVNGDSKDIKVKLSNVGFAADGSKVFGNLDFGKIAESATIDAFGTKNGLNNVKGSALKELTLNTTDRLDLADVRSLQKIESIDGSNATGALNIGSIAGGVVSTGQKVDIKTGSGNDVVYLQTVLPLGSSIDLGAGDDKILHVGSGGIATTIGSNTVKVDGGTGRNTVSAKLLNNSNSAQWYNFQIIDLQDSTAGVVDVGLLTNSKGIDTIIQDVAGSGHLTINDINTDSTFILKKNHTTDDLIINVKGALGYANDGFTVKLDGDSTGVALGTGSKGLRLDGVENVFIQSGGDVGATNKVNLLENTQLHQITITGDRDLTLTASATNGTSTLDKIDASGLSGKLKITVDSNFSTTSSAQIIGGSNNDTIIYGNSKGGITMTGGYGSDTFEINGTALYSAATIGAANANLITITDLERGEKVIVNTAKGANAGNNLASFTQVTGVNDSMTEVAAMGLFSNSSAAADKGLVQWLNYQGDTYIFMDGGASGYADDFLIKLSGVKDLTYSSHAKWEWNGGGTQMTLTLL